MPPFFFGDKVKTNIRLRWEPGTYSHSVAGSRLMPREKEPPEEPQSKPPSPGSLAARPTLAFDVGPVLVPRWLYLEFLSPQVGFQLLSESKLHSHLTNLVSALVGSSLGP